MSIILGVGNVLAQSEVVPFEGEATARVFSSQKMNSAVLTKNFITKIILKSITKKYLDNNPALYNGAYTSTTIIKGNKTCVKNSSINTVTITYPENGKVKTVCYFPYIKKGYYGYDDPAAEQNKQQAQFIQKGEVEKTGETMDIMGHKCDVYKVKYENVVDSAGTKMSNVMHNEYAICQDSSLSAYTGVVIPGLHGAPLKFTTNVVSQISNKMLNVDTRISLSSVITSITPRSVADSEFEVPADIKLVDISKKPKEYYKLYAENTNYLKKAGLWIDPAKNEDKIYDNLSEDWDY